MASRRARRSAARRRFEPCERSRRRIARTIDRPKPREASSTSATPMAGKVCTVRRDPPWAPPRDRASSPSGVSRTPTRTPAASPRACSGRPRSQASKARRDSSTRRSATSIGKHSPRSTLRPRTSARTRPRKSSACRSARSTASRSPVSGAPSRIENSAPKESAASRSGSTTTETGEGTSTSSRPEVSGRLRSCSLAESSSRRALGAVPCDSPSASRCSTASRTERTTSSNGTARSCTATRGSGPAR